MITREMVSEKLLAYLDNQLSLNQVVAWANQVIAQGNYAPDSHIDSLVNIVMRLTDDPQVPVAQAEPSELMNRPQAAVMVLPRNAA